MGRTIVVGPYFVRLTAKVYKGAPRAKGAPAAKMNRSEGWRKDTLRPHSLFFPVEKAEPRGRKRCRRPEKPKRRLCVSGKSQSGV